MKDYCNNYDLTSLNVKAGDVITVSPLAASGLRGEHRCDQPTPFSGQRAPPQPPALARHAAKCTPAPSMFVWAVFSFPNSSHFSFMGGGADLLRRRSLLLLLPALENGNKVEEDVWRREERRVFG